MRRVSTAESSSSADATLGGEGSATPSTSRRPSTLTAGASISTHTKAGRACFLRCPAPPGPRDSPAAGDAVRLAPPSSSRPGAARHRARLAGPSSTRPGPRLRTATASSAHWSRDGSGTGPTPSQGGDQPGLFMSASISAGESARL